MRASLEAVEAAVPHRFELAMLALRDPRMEPEFLPLVEISDDAGRRFADAERGIRLAVTNHGRTPKVVRNTIEFLAFRDSEPLLAAASRGLGYSPLSMVHAVTAELSGGESPALHRLLQVMPIQGAFTELRVQSHLKAQWNTKDSDLIDFLALATTLPFVDFCLTDAKTYHLAADAGLSGRGMGVVLRSLRSLCDQMQAHLTAESRIDPPVRG